MAEKNDKALFFDTGPIISLVMSRLLWILPELKNKFGGKFYITPAVQKELVERPLTVKRFEFEALQIMKLIRDGVLEVYNKVPQKTNDQLLSIANKSFKVKDNYVEIIQSGEIESVVSVIQTNAEGLVMDERTMRLLIEDPAQLKSLLEQRFRSEVSQDKEMLNKFSQQVGKIKIIRSIELVAVAYKMGILDIYLPAQPDAREVLADSVLWATKFNGCAVTDAEVEQIKKYISRH